MGFYKAAITLSLSFSYIFIPFQSSCVSGLQLTCIINLLGNIFSNKAFIDKPKILPIEQFAVVGINSTVTNEF